MTPVDETDYSPDRIRRLLSGVPFFNQILRQDESQFQQLKDCLKFHHAGAGEVVIKQGDTDRGLYFLLRGRLEVTGADKAGKPLYHTSAGELFGVLAMLRESPRTASLTVPDDCKEVLLARLEPGLFDDIHGDERFTLATKLSFYHMVVHHIRWALEMNRVQYPHHPLVSEMLKMPLFLGARETEEELQSLHEQAYLLADILYRWNQFIEG